MNYVKIHGQRINLLKILGYTAIGKTVYIDLNFTAEHPDDIHPNASMVFEFDTPEVAQRCLNFLDKKTKCETFKLAKPE